MKNIFKIPSSEITDKKVYLSRRNFIKRIGLIPLSIPLLTSCNPPITNNGYPLPASQVDEITSLQDITGYTNYYEFATDKIRPTELSKDYITSPWKITVDGLVNYPKTYDPDELKKRFGQEERIYRMRCVEGWSMVIPWMGFSLSKLITEVEPTSSARYIRFESPFDPNQMPGQNASAYPWPYNEGLRLDEGIHELTLLATGLYGDDLPPQNGAPIRLVVPWKYGFKSIKAITHIEFVSDMPATFWSTLSPNEYGFFANVNPAVPHPRWTQSTERRIGENSRRDTIIFNDYSDHVSNLYEGMDLANYF